MTPPIQAMPAKAFTLHEALKRNGYGVHLIFSGDHTNFYGLREMYGPVDSYFDGSQQRYKGGGDLEVALRYMNDDQLVLDRLAVILELYPADRLLMYDLAAQTHRYAAADLPKYISQYPYVLAALGKVQDAKAGMEQRPSFIQQMN